MYAYIYYVLPPAKCIQVCHDHLRTQTSKSFCPGRPGQFEASSTHQSFAKNKRITLEQWPGNESLDFWKLLWFNMI